MLPVIEKLTNTIKAVRPPKPVSDAIWDAKEAYRTAFRGFSRLDSANAGSSEALRLAGMLRYMSELDWPNGTPFTGAELRKAADGIRGYYASRDDSSSLFLMQSFSVKVDDAGHIRPDNDTRETLESMPDAFMGHWEWIGENIFMKDYELPEVLSGKDWIARRETARHDVWTNSDDGPGNLVANAARRIKNCGDELVAAVGRLSSSEGYSVADVAALPTAELYRISKMFEELSLHSPGNPDGYYEDGFHLKTRDAAWLGQQSMAVSQWGNTEEKQRVHYDAGDGVIGIRNNDYNPDYASWVEDLEYAAFVFDSYATWKAPEGMKDAYRALGMGEYHISVADVKMDEEFRAAWIWMGRHIEALYS